MSAIIKKAITVHSTPKERFQTAANIRAHQALVDSASFEAGADAAMLEYSRKLSEETNAQTPGVTGLKLQGAHEFLKVLKTLAEPPPVLPKRPDLDNLKHTETRRS